MSSRFILDSPSSLYNWKTRFFFVTSDGWETIPSENLGDTPKFLCSWGTLVSRASLYTCLFARFLLYI